MFLKRFRQIRKKIGFRISAGYVLFFLMSSAVVFTVLYLLLATFLERRDRQLVESRLNQFNLIYKMEGVAGLQRVTSDRKQWADGPKLLVRLQSPDGSVLFIHLPEQNNDFSARELLNLTNAKYPAPAFTTLVSAKDSDDVLEIMAQKLADGNVLQVGKDTDDREENLEQFRLAFLAIMVPLLLLGAFGGWLFSKRSLKPIRTFIRTIRSIQSGNLGARAPRSGNGDELDELALVFNRMLDRNDKLIGSMKESFDAVSHDLKTPMTRIMGLAERGLAMPNLDDKNAALVECMESSEEILNLLNSILDISEAESGAMSLGYQNLAGRDLLNEVRDLYEVVAEDREIELTVDADDSHFSADVRVKQALANLVDNALKYSPSGTQVKLFARGTGDDMIFEVSDQGHGIPQNEFSKIWERLYRGDKSRATKGAGLGLSLVRSIVLAHGGTVHVESQVGRGSTFRILIPTQPASLQL